MGTGATRYNGNKREKMKRMHTCEQLYRVGRSKENIVANNLGFINGYACDKNYYYSFTLLKIRTLDLSY